jgi:hypothetical protein
MSIIAWHILDLIVGFVGKVVNQSGEGLSSASCAALFAPGLLRVVGCILSC